MDARTASKSLLRFYIQRSTFYIQWGDASDIRVVGWMDRLAVRWGVAPSRVLIILLVFACTGFTVMFLKKPLVAWAAGDGEAPAWFTVAYYILILPFYNVLLLIYGGLLGQFRFFWEFEKRFFRRLFGKRKRSSAN